MKDYQFDTLQVHAGQVPDKTTGACAVPIYQTSAYYFDGMDHAQALFELKAEGNIYTRIMNPTTDVFEKRMAALEGGVGALALSSGMAAITLAVLNIAGTGDHILAASTLYGGTYNLFRHTLPRYGITTTFVDPDDYDAWSAAIQPNTKAVYVEILGNPNCNIADLERAAEIAHSHGLPLFCDATFATPYLLRPIQHGVDVVIHSATKFLGGHGTSIAGVIVDGGKFDWAKSGKFPGLVEPDVSYHGVSYTKDVGAAAFITKARVQLLRDLGSCISPFNSFLLLMGLETLSLRMEKHVQNTQEVAKFLQSRPEVEQVNYPSLAGDKYHALAQRYFPKGAGSIFTFEIKGGKETARKFCEALQLFSYIANVADAKSLVIHPASTTHSQMDEKELLSMGIHPSTVRLSIGIEAAGDLIADLAQALEKI